jgi:hypothetical protein
VFSPGGAIPSEYTCDGADISPPLTWSGLPEGTNSLVLVALYRDRGKDSRQAGIMPAKATALTSLG